MTIFLKHLSLFGFVLLADYLLRGFYAGEMVQNYGFIFGSISQASPYIRIIFLSVLWGIFGMVATFFYAFLSSELSILKWGMTLLLSGMAGNSLEKLLYGFVWDYFQVPALSRYVFNLHDVVQIIGLVLVIYELFAKRNILWFQSAVKRKRLILYENIQFPFMAKVLGFVALMSLTQGILTVGMLFPYLVGVSKSVENLYIVSLLAINLVTLPLLGYFILKEILRCVAPVYALEKYLKEDRQDPFKLRSTDYFQTLETNFNSYREKKKS
jgi:lipoprotein signal peptidase